MASTCLKRNRCSIFKTKGLLVVLVWCFSVSNVFHFSDSTLVVGRIKFGQIIFFASILLSPLYGLLADMKWSRYKLIKLSLLIMWITSIIYALMIAVLSSVQASVVYVLYASLLLVMCLCFGAITVNLVEFGIDQLIDGSSSDIAASACWFVWVFYASKVLHDFVENCTPSEYRQLSFLVVPLSLTIAVALGFLSGHLLIKEPPSSNPLKLIYEVLKFYFKNKQPRLRSAFTYWDDKPYSRIDLGKAKYGGPFSAEQVENVKTILRISALLVVFGFSMGFYIIFNAITNGRFSMQILSHGEKDEHNIRSNFKCTVDTIYTSSGYIISLIWLPINELGLYQLFRRWKILFKISFGCFIIIISSVSQLALASVEYVHFDHSNSTTCSLLHKDIVIHTHISHYWYILPHSMLGIGQFVVFASMFEFMCAQTPHSAKGILTGLAYGCVSIGSIVSLLIFYMLELSLKHWPQREQGRCVLWILLAGNTVFVSLLVLLYWVFWRYKKRSRDDMEINEHMFVSRLL